MYKYLIVYTKTERNMFGLFVSTVNSVKLYWKHISHPVSSCSRMSDVRDGDQSHWKFSLSSLKTVYTFQSELNSFFVSLM